MPHVTVAAVQPAAHERTNLARAWPDLGARIREAAASGAQLVVLPEGTLPAYVLGYERFEMREIDDALRGCQGMARELGIVLVVGAARRDGQRLFNSAAIIDRDGAVAGYADKHFLWHFDRQWFSPGERLEPVRTSIGTIGALICADGRIPTIARALVDRGAQLLVMPTAWVTSGRDPHDLENVQADLLARVRARENGVPFVASNKCGTERGCVAYCGKSQIVRADGTIAAMAAQDGPQTIVARVEVGARVPIARTQSAPTPECCLDRTARIAIAAREPPRDGEEMLRILEADMLISPAQPYAFTVTDEVVLDPGGLVNARLSGMNLAVWETAYEPAWQVTFARARALELRMYLVVIDAQHDRAYAVDPDGTVLCGTFPGYDVAAFAYDPARAGNTTVAPRTDVRSGLQRAQHAAP